MKKHQRRILVRIFSWILPKDGAQSAGSPPLPSVIFNLYLCQKNMEHFTSRLAQDIVDELCGTISHNIYITDRYGRVIASNNLREIGRLNLGAMNALNSRNVFRVWVKTDTQNTGASVPIAYSGSIIGALSLEGDLQEINPVLPLLKTSVELLIHQKAILDSSVQIRRIHEQFLREWFSLRGEYDQSFISRGLELNKDVLLPRIAVVFRDRDSMEDMDSLLADILERSDAYISHSNGVHVALIADNPKFPVKLQRILEQGLGEQLGISRPSGHAFGAITQAGRALEIGEKFLRSEQVIAYEQVRLVDETAGRPCTGEMRRIIGLLEANGRSANLVQTLFTYVYHNGNIQKTIDELFIHRNSLNYRFQRIREITGYDPEKLQELMFLYTALVCTRMEGANPVGIGTV